MDGLKVLQDRIQQWHDAAVKAQAKLNISTEYRNYLQGRASMAATIILEIQEILDSKL